MILAEGEKPKQLDFWATNLLVVLQKKTYKIHICVEIGET